MAEVTNHMRQTAAQFFATAKDASHLIPEGTTVFAGPTKKE